MPECADQTTNLKYMIEYYRNGGTPPPIGETWYFLDGSRIAKEHPKSSGPPWAIWAEDGFLLETQAYTGPTTRAYSQQVIGQAKLLSAESLSANPHIFAYPGPHAQLRLAGSTFG